MYEVVLGRSNADRKVLGLAGTIFLGKLYVKMGAVTSLSNKVFLDVAKAHIILIAGKRGSGKSYSGAVIAEEIATLPDEVRHRLAVLIVDTLGIFWTMKFQNEKDEDLLREWGLEKKNIDVTIYTPTGKFNEYKEKGIPADVPFAIRPAELTTEDWAGLFGVSLLDATGVVLERNVEKVRGEIENFSIEDLIESIKNDHRAEENVKNVLENRFLAARGWGIFSKEGTPLREIIQSGKVSVLDVSVYAEWTVKALVVGILCKKLMSERMAARKLEEVEDIQRGFRYFKSGVEENESELPIVWIFIDEVQEFLPVERKTLATDALVQILREGRQPGVCLVMATQQPAEVHKDVWTQTDIVISHRVTARKDIEALNAMMQTYATGDIQKFLNALPDERGAAVVLDDNAERLYPIRVRPRFTWHGGEAPLAVKSKGTAVRELGL